MTKKRSFVPTITKVFLALASFTGTIGLWNFLSNREYKAGETNQNPDLNKPELQPIPTLVSLIDITDTNLSSTSPEASSQSITELRKVQLSLAPVPASQPPVSASNSPIILPPPPVTNTRSSR